MKGSNDNIIYVNQGGKQIVYNLNDSKQNEAFIKYLKSIPKIRSQIETVLKTTLNNSEKLDSNNSKLDQILSLVSKKSTQQGLFDLDLLNSQIFNYKAENEELKAKIDKLRLEDSTNKRYSVLLVEANKKLDAFDNDGYQKLLDEYLIKIKDEYLKEVAEVSYLQAINLYNNGKDIEALEKINIALGYDSTRTKYLSIKAVIYFMLNQFQNSISTYLKISDSNVSSKLTCAKYNNIAASYLSLGKYKEALVYSLLSIEKSEKLFSQNKSDLADKYGLLGLNYLKLGDYENGFYFLQKALKINDSIYGLGHFESSAIYNNLGLYYLFKKDYVKSIEYFNLTLKVSEGKCKVYKETIVTYTNLGDSYIGLKKHHSALKYYYKAIEISKLFNEANYPPSADAYEKAAHVEYEIGKTQIAINLLKKALYIRQVVYNEPKLIISKNCSDIGMFFLQIKQYDSSIYYLLKSIKIAENIKGIKSVRLVERYNNLAVVYFYKKEYKSSVNIFDKSLQIIENSKDVDNLTLFETYSGIGETYCVMNEFNNAIKYYHKSLSCDSKSTGDICYIKFKLAISYCKLGKKDKSKLLFEQTFKCKKMIENLGYNLTEEYKKCSE